MGKRGEDGEKIDGKEEADTRPYRATRLGERSRAAAFDINLAWVVVG
jgi:hypothetical protein